MKTFTNGLEVVAGSTAECGAGGGGLLGAGAITVGPGSLEVSPLPCSLVGWAECCGLGGPGQCVRQCIDARVSNTDTGSASCSFNRHVLCSPDGPDVCRVWRCKVVRTRV